MQHSSPHSPRLAPIGRPPRDISKGLAKDCALYKVTDTFTVGPGSTFFDPTQPFAIYLSSADCNNEFMLYQSDGVPEPSGLIWLVPALFLLGSYLRRRSIAQVK